MAKIKFGTIVGITENIEASFNEVKNLGLDNCQISCGAEFMVDRLKPKAIRQAAKNTGVEITSFFLVFDGQVYDLVNGPKTMGFIAPEFRAKRLELAYRFSDMVAEMGVKSITSHVGFIPDDKTDPVYTEFLPVMRKFIEHCKKNSQIFCFETGQELPSTLKHTILDLDMPNVGINLDPANLILYGMAHPLDAVEIFGEYIKGMHGKDGLWPNRNDSLGVEVPVGQGKTNFPVLIPRLIARGFKGPITIEREISGPQQKKDILSAIEFLKKYV